MPPTSRRVLALLLVVSLGHVLLISAQVQSRSGLPVVEDVAFGAFARVQRLMSAIGDGGTSLWTRYFALSGIARENEALRRRILDLEGQLQEQQAVTSRTRALEEILALRESVLAPTMAARVIAGSPQPGSLTIVIDRGADDGVDVDMAVIAARGVVGRVIAPLSAHAAVVQLIIGRNAGAAAKLERSGAGGLIRRTSGDPSLQMDLVSNFVDVTPGERVFTSGQDGIYPQGFLIGTVERTSRGDGLYRDIRIRPSVDFSHIEMVLIVLSPPKGPPAGGGA
jgi:rod shape-determining protein MreC